MKYDAILPPQIHVYFNRVVIFKIATFFWYRVIEIILLYNLHIHVLVRPWAPVASYITAIVAAGTAAV